MVFVDNTAVKSNRLECYMTPGFLRRPTSLKLLSLLAE